MRTFLSALAATLIAVTPLVAVAQSAPSYAIPSDDNGSGDAQIRGRVVSFDGGYGLSVADEKGYTDRVRLHQGTIINPTGLTLAPGMVVSVLGFNAGGTFSANEIDTPYESYGGDWYYHGHPYGYYGPSIGLAFFFGNGGWWHGSYFGGPYRFDNGFRIYASVGYRAYARGPYGYGYGRGYEYGSYGHGGYDGRGGYYGHGGYDRGYASVRGGPGRGYAYGHDRSSGGYARGYAGNRGGFHGHEGHGH